MAWLARDDDSLDDDGVDVVGVVVGAVDDEEKARNEVEVPPLVADDEAA